MARKARSKSGKEKPLAQLAPRVGEYVLKAREVAKLSDTLQEQIAAIQEIVRLKQAIGENIDKAYEMMDNKKAEIYKTLFDTWVAIACLYDVIKSPPPEFNKVAASLVGVVGVIKGIDQIPDDDFERTCESFRWLAYRHGSVR